MKSFQPQKPLHSDIFSIAFPSNSWCPVVNDGGKPIFL
jgi:hypothetical protein